MSTSFYSLDAEKAVIGGILKFPLLYDELSCIIDNNDFSSNLNQKIWSTVELLHKKNQIFDEITIASHLNGAIKAETLISFKKNINEEKIKEYAEVVRNFSIKRILKDGNEDLLKTLAIESHDKISDIIYKAEQQVIAATDKLRLKASDASFKTTLPSVLLSLKERANQDTDVTGLSTGFSDLDKLTSGVFPGQLIIVAGRPAMGKTTMACNVLDSIMLKGGRAAAFSLEMSSEELVEKSIASIGDIKCDSIKTGRFGPIETARLERVVGELNELDLIINDGVDITMSELRAQALRWHREKPLDILMVDYLQLMKLPNNNTATRSTLIGDISRGLKMLAKELEIPIIVLSQLSRDVEKRMDKRPVCSDLRDSGSIEQDADMIIFLYRDEVYDQDSKDKGLAEIIVAKQRKGPLGTVKVQFQGEYSRFKDIAKTEQEYDQQYQQEQISNREFEDLKTDNSIPF